MNLVLDLIFLKTRLEKFNNHIISPDLWSPSDYISLLVFIIIEEKFIQKKKWSIIRNSDKENFFISELRYKLDSIETANIISCETLKHVT